MIFPTIEFAAFFAAVLALNWLLMPNPRLWKPFMLGASYVFYGYADWRFTALLAFSTLWNQTAATLIGRQPEGRVRRWMLGVAVGGNLALLGWFKYFDFFVNSVNEVLDRIGLNAPLPLLQVALPIGISFFTFQAISYVVDVYKGLIAPARPLDFAIYEAFFPHLVAGPIVRAREFLPQLVAPRDPRNIPAAAAFLLIAGGMFKKIVLADFLATRIVDPVFASPSAHSAGETLVAVYGYAVQIYCDFSAYTDMAIGLALLLGFRFPQNFDRPYTAVSLQDFWRRWHMTLSRWLRDYLYVPLGGSRDGRAKTYRNLMLTMLLGGLWHGASWTFVIWGGIHGGGLAVERWMTERRARAAPSDDVDVGPTIEIAPAITRESTATLLVQRRTVLPANPSMTPVWVRRLVTFQVVCIAWVFFRAPDLSVALQVFERLVHWGPSPLVSSSVLLAVGLGLALQYVPDRAWRTVHVVFGSWPFWAQGLLLGGFLVLINAIVGEQGVAPFLYFRF